MPKTPVEREIRKAISAINLALLYNKNILSHIPLCEARNQLYLALDNVLNGTEH